MSIDSPEARIVLVVNERLLRSLAERGEAETVHVLGGMAAEHAASLLQSVPLPERPDRPAPVAPPDGLPFSVASLGHVGLRAATAAAAIEQKDMARAMRMLRSELASDGRLDGVYASSVVEQAVEELQKARRRASTRGQLADVRGRRRDALEQERAALKAALEARKEMHEEHKAELRNAIEERDSLRETASELHRQISEQDNRLAAIRDTITSIEAERIRYDDAGGMRFAYMRIKKALGTPCP